MKKHLGRIIKEPLLHFLVLAVLLFQAYKILNPEEQEVIKITEGNVQQLYERFTILWHREPTKEELSLAVRTYAIEQIYAKEGKLLGLDEGDGAINKRLKSKIQLMIADAVLMAKPKEKELKAFFEENKAKYAPDSKFTFKQVSLNVNQDKAILKTQIEEQNKRIADGLEPIGVTTSLEPSYVDIYNYEVEKLFGNKFDENLVNAELNKWSGPFYSGIGVHYFYVTNRVLENIPSYEEVADRVKDDYRQARLTQAIIDYEEEMLKQYKVELPDGEIE